MSWTRFVAPCLLVATAIVQIALARMGPLNPAKGGGFGLFSTVDKLENRILLAALETPNGDLPIAVVQFEDQVKSVVSFPSARRLDHFGRLLAASRAAPPEATALRLEVWKRAFDVRTGEHRRILVAKRSVPLAR